MSAKKFKSQASSGRAISGFGFGGSALGTTHSSSLSYIQEPPDYSTITNANTIVAFKNLSKKDSTTKVKALEEIQAYITNVDTDVEDGLLEAWVKLYPRLSIDSARRVRQLAHVVNGYVCSKAGKRSGRHLPSIAGPWLAGSHDTDRAAAKAAQDAFALVFPTPEKVAGLRRTFQGAILAYCRDSLFHETVQTLNDERTVSPDDADATYARVVSTSMAVITALLSELDSSEVSKQQVLYDELFSNPKLWEFGCHADTGVRRTAHRLLQATLQKQPDSLRDHLKQLSTAYVYKGLISDQTGSAADYMTALDALTRQFPSIWTTEYSGKKSALSRLKQCLKHGSRSGSSDYWTVTRSLFQHIPQEVLPSSAEDAKELLLAARDGVTQRDERFNASGAWQAYYALLDRIVRNLHEEDCKKLLDTCASPIVRQYLQPSPETVDWTVAGAKPSALVARLVHIDAVLPMLQVDLAHFADELVNTAKMSQPQQSKDFAKSQLHVASCGERWASLQRELYAQRPSASLSRFLDATNVQVLKECAQLLQARQGKPFGTAAIVEELLRGCGAQLQLANNFPEIIQDLLMTDDFSWVHWPSNRQLVGCLLSVHDQSYFGALYEGALMAALRDTSESPTSMVRVLLPQNAPQEALSLAKANSQLQELVMSSLSASADEAERFLFTELYAIGAVSDETANEGVSQLISNLVNNNNPENLRSSLDLLAAIDDRLLQSIVTKPQGQELLPNLIRIEEVETAEDVVEKAAALISRLSTAANGHVGFETKLDVVRQGLQRASLKSLSVDSLRDLTQRLLGADGKVAEVHTVLPDVASWRATVMATVRAPKPSLAVLSSLGGCVHLVQDLNAANDFVVQTDSEGFSQALRVAMYLVRCCKVTDDPTTAALLYMTVLLAEDNLSIPGTNALWDSTLAEDVAIVDFVTEGNSYLGWYWEATGLSDETKADFLSALVGMQEGYSSYSAMAYYVSLAQARVNANYFGTHHNAEQVKHSEAELTRQRSEGNTLATTACIVGLQQPLAGTQTLTRLLNALVAGLTDAELQASSLEQFILLNSILSAHDDAVSSIAKQRLVFLVKHLVVSVQNAVDPVISSETCKALTLLLPGMQDMYGEHWAQCVSYIIKTWATMKPEHEPTDGWTLVMNSTLRLHSVLRKLSKHEDPNDDLLDALKDHERDLSTGLVGLLLTRSGVSDGSNQPLLVTHELLARQVTQVLRGKTLKDASMLYPLLYTPSRSVQHATFELLHQHIPVAQEQISFDAALENKTPHLPDELLSLILESPTLESLIDASFDGGMPVQLAGYLYSWRLIFDHFEGSSYRVKSDYTEQLKDGTYLPDLLRFTFDFIGHTRGKPVEISRFDVRAYTPDEEPNPERDVQWLLSHLYYLALTNVPGLVRSYYLDLRSRQTSQAVESWTAKHVSPLIIESSLRAVAEWAEKSVKEDPEYEKMSVKVGMRSKEINVSYVVDEQTMAIKVVLPDAYPLAAARVEGVSRVAVKEEKWQSWLRNCQGVITFSNGSIIDGLSAWRKNVVGALQNQTECAICYSLVSADKQLPTKRCMTCKNAFHASCLIRWFKTSNASTCPLCRSSFQFS
ncbi:hypothetical protein BAUCODRAFT_34518 [Baudoinia panamericana UAMH 10762]|uniref:E3 ubiquitin-protein ligase listerin n=1 Tax=Baudoinia panamericana (strain UAMH 10762) TaxID=717646 RepID=M2NA63_BAUPA|nr:uncharacterized protein BAUCODRAFT_34518 [Baudoinia panamericana UAMH 10762]EMC95750.1 hypothetical protein BAUCODRAFT_34518 [Baudoinia panamericana UAMH 10762]